MRIIVDMSALVSPGAWRTGLVQYGLRFLDGLSSEQRKNISILATNDVAEEFHTLYPDCQTISYSLTTSNIAKRLSLKTFLDSLKWRKAANAAEGDVLFRIAQVPKYNFWKLNKRTVMTLHDLIVLRSEKKPPFYQLSISRALKNADHIITISNFVREDLLNTFPKISSSKVTVIHNGVKLPDFKKTDLPFKGPYILTVNALVPHKNVITLLKAFNLIKDTIPENLVIVGKESSHYKEVLFPYILNNGLQDRVILIPFASDDLLYSLYGSTDLFITTSLEEGFGFTPIEAAMSGARVLSTEETALKESTMGLVNYYSPATDEFVLSKKILEVLNNDTHNKEVVKNAMNMQYNPVSQAQKIYNTLEQHAR